MHCFVFGKSFSSMQCECLEKGYCTAFKRRTICITGALQCKAGQLAGKVHLKDDAEVGKKSDSGKKFGFPQKIGLISCMNHKFKSSKTLAL